MSKEDKVKADYMVAVAAREHCTYDPFTCDYAAIAIPGSPMDVQTRQTVKQRTDLNLRAVPGKGSVRFRIESVGFEGDSAFVTICAYDTVVIYDVVDAANTEDDIVYNDDVGSYRVRWEMRNDGVNWMLYMGTNSDRVIGSDICEF